MMLMKKEQISFLKRAIESLTQEAFDEAVQIFQKYYLKNEIIDVNGTNDGGCDIKIYKNKRETKKCVQVTVRKDWEKKLKKELQNVNELITKYNYSEKYDFFCSSVISEKKIEECKQYATNEYDIDLTIYEANRLSQLDCPRLKDYIYSLHNDIILNPSQLNVDRETKTIYDFLTISKGSTDIKNDILNSFIISILYAKESMDIESLKDELEKRLHKSIPDITHLINLLKSAQRVIKDPHAEDKIKLSEKEFNQAKDIFAYASLVEQEFEKGFQEIVSKFRVTHGDDILQELKKLYKDYYKNDIDDSSNNTNKKDEDVFKSFNTYLNNIIPEPKIRRTFVCEIKKLCEENTYLNRISASESFLSLYKSDRLEQYKKKKKKSVFVDTPVFVYLLCAIFQIDNANDWNDSLYRSVKSLYELQCKNPERVKFNIMIDYIGEVVGELKKAYQIALLEDAPFFSNLGKTRNTFYNYYRHLKDNDLMEESEKIHCVGDFLKDFGVEEIAFEENNDASLNKRLREIVEDMNIRIEHCPYYEEFNRTKIIYEKQLYDKSKSDSAKNNDIKQMLYLLNNDRNTDEVFITWDNSLQNLKDRLMNTNWQYKNFPIYNPAKLSNKIALECFNIDSSAITNDIFIYADKTFSISNKVKSLLDILAPIFGSKEARQNRVLKSLGDIRKQQNDSPEYNEAELNNQNLPIEEVLIKMIDLVCEKDKEEQKNSMMNKFKAFMMNQQNENYIVEVVTNGSKELANNKELDLSEFIKKVSDVEIK